MSVYCDGMIEPLAADVPRVVPVVCADANTHVGVIEGVAIVDVTPP